MIPGGLAWLGLILVLTGAYAAPLGVLFGAALLSLYSAVRFTFAGVANGLGLRLVRRWDALDWQAEYRRRATPESLPLDVVHHVVIIPNYHEEIDTLRRSLEHLSRQVRACVMSVALAMEASEANAQEKAAQLHQEFGTRFANFFVVIHPSGIVGEMQCKSANQAWAARQVRHILVNEMGYHLNHLVVTSMDADTLWHPRYFESLGVLFATDPQRYATYWQAPIRYHGNVWSSHPLIRILHVYSSAWELAYLAAPWWRALPMSSYSMSMRLLNRAGYWDPDVIADEWHMYIKTYFQRAVRLQPIFLPFWANVTTGRGIGGAVKERYLQTLRHAWGAKEITYTITQINEHPQVSLRGGLSLLFRVAHDNLLAGAGWIVMLVGGQLPVWLHPGLLHDGAAVWPVLLLQVSAMIVTLLIVVFWALDMRLRPPRPDSWSWRDGLYELVSLPLLAVMTLVCVALPVLHAQTRLMLGLPLEFRVSPKR
jgi:hypothetical protein